MMEEKIQEHMATLLEWVEKGFGFAADQAPLVVQEILAWGFWSNLTNALLCSACALLLVIVAWKLGWIVKKENDKDFREQSDGVMVIGSTGTAVSFVGSVFFIAATISSVKTCIMIQVAPRVYLIETIRGMF